MSWFRFAGTSRVGSNRPGIWERIFSRRKARSRKGASDHRDGRSLRIDPLESRCLLSVTAATLSAMVINQTFGGDQTTTTAQSVASDNNGDFVVTWTRDDSVAQCGWHTIIDPATGGPYQVDNIYARYFTPTVEQITLPANTASFSLKDNDQTVEQISVTAGTAPNGDPNAPIPDIAGTFTCRSTPTATAR